MNNPPPDGPGCAADPACLVCGGPVKAEMVHFPLLESEDSGPGYDVMQDFCLNPDCDGHYL